MTKNELKEIQSMLEVYENKKTVHGHGGYNYGYCKGFVDALKWVKNL